MTVSFIVDASVIAEFVVKGDYTIQARQLISSLDQGDELWIPEFCLLECANVLWKRVRFKQAVAGDARLLILDLCELPFTIGAIRDLLPRALEIGILHELTIYDSLYLALAEIVKVELITLDKSQAKAAQSLGVPLKPITDFTPQAS